MVVNIKHRGLRAAVALACSSAVLFGGISAANAAESADRRFLYEDQPLTMTSATNWDMSHSTLKAVPLALYAYASIEDNDNDDPTDDVITAYDTSTNSELIDSINPGLVDAINQALQTAKIDTSTVGPSKLKYDAKNPMPWVLDNLLDSVNSPWAGKLRDFFDALKNTQAFKDQVREAQTMTVSAHSATANVRPGIYAVVDTTAQGRASILAINGTGINGVTTLKGKTPGSKTYTLGTLEYKGHDVSVSKEIINVEDHGDHLYSDTSAHVQLGHFAQMQLDSTVPNWTGYDQYYYALNDTYSDGLTFDKSSVKVEKAAADSENYTVLDTGLWHVSETDGGFVVRFGTETGNIIPNKDVFGVGDKIRVTYKMRLNKNVVAFEPETNKIDVEYSRNPNTWTDHEIVEGNKVYVFTSQLKLSKTDMEGNPLKGAEFTVTRVEPKPMAETDESSDDGLVKVIGSNGKYRIAEDGESGTTTTLVTDDNGKIVLTGALGEYLVKETKSPLGMTRLPSFVIHISLEHNGEASEVVPRYRMVEYDSDHMVGFDHDHDHVQVVNARNLMEMPKTGATWMVIFGVGAGSLLLASILGLTLALKRKRA